MRYRIVVLGSILPNTIPGWASSAATMFTYLFGLNEGTVPIITTIFLLAIALSVTVSPVVYKTVERVELILVAIIVVFLLVAIVIATDLSWTGIIRSEGGMVEETHLRKGEPDKEILRSAEALGVGAILIGSRRLGAIRRLMGNVSDSVVRHAHGPVFLMRH